jgi:hypothetical protein
MAAPKPDLPIQRPSVASPFVDEGGRLTPEGYAVLAAAVALTRRVNDHEARLAALEP